MPLLIRNGMDLCRKTFLMVRGFHTIMRGNVQQLSPQLLTAKLVDFMPVCGYKVKGILNRRCRSCFFIRREERLYVECKAHPRHKQMSMVKDRRNTWILTHATQGKVRQW